MLKEMPLSALRYANIHHALEEVLETNLLALLFYNVFEAGNGHCKFRPSRGKHAVEETGKGRI